MKKLLAIFLFALMLCTLIPFATVSAAEAEPTIELSLEVEEVEAGDEFQVYVNLLNLEDTAGLIAALVEIGFDTDVFETVTYFDEDEEMWVPQIEIGPKYSASSNKYITFGQIYDDGTMKNCLVKYLRATAKESQVRYEEEFCTITLRVKDDAASGTYDLEVIEKEGIYYGGVKFEFATTKASVTIGGSAPACDHVEWGVIPSYTANNDGTHNVKYTCENCGVEVAEESKNIPCFDDRDSDGICDACNAKIPCEHEYKYDCDKVCAKCGEETRPEAKHEYTYACDAHCAICHELTNEGAEHNISHVKAKDATCTENGNIEYWYCEICRSAWADEGLTQVTNLKSVILPAGHSFLEGRRGDLLSAGDCVTPATYATKCDRCDVEDETKVITGELGDHTLVHVEAKLADCVNDGNIEHWYCSKCGQYWLDAELTENTNKDKVICPASGHFETAADNGDGTHRIECCVCPTVLQDNIPHDFTSGEAEHTCVCGAVEHVCKHDEYATTATTHQSICECGAPLGDEEEHEFENGKCVVCEYECQHGDEMGSFPEGCVSNGDGTHSWLALCDCGVTYAESTDECSGGTANCVMQAICSDCGTEYGDIDPANHAGEKLYRDSFENMSQHLVYCNKCGELWDSQNPYAPHEADEEGYCKCGLFVVVQDFNGGQISTKPPYPEMTEEAWTDMVESQLGGFDVTSMSRFTFGLSILVEDENIAMMNLMFVKEGYKLVGLAYDAEGTQRYNGENIEKPTTLYYVWEPLHTHAHDHYDITETTHQSICSCGEILGEAEDHDYTFDETTHKCVCDKVETFTLTVNVLGTGDTVELTVPYGANLLEVLAKAAEERLIPALGDAVPVNDELCIGINIPTRYSYFDADEQDWIHISENDTMPASDYDINQEIIFTGWGRPDTDQPWGYQVEDIQIEGWYKVDGAWYFFFMDEETGWSCRAEGLSRVPYPTAPINGILYAPNAEDLAYAANKGREFIDATEAWFVFGEDGKFQFDMTEIMDGKYVENGMIAWHPGFVTVGGELYYFVGDKENGGNIWANGDVIVSRLNGAEGFVNNGTYNFVDGRLNKQNGIFPSANGKQLYYYINGHKQVKLGLTKLGEGKYIYVRSNGELAVGEYYIPANGLGVVSTLYTFDAKGYMVNPKYTNVNGIVDGYYYVDGKIVYGAGLINIDGDIYYVRSSGKVATGEYYITNTNGMPGFQKGMKLTFGADGKLLTKTTDFGSVINGYYYVGGKIAYGAGVVKMEDENGVFYIYVKSNGQLATGKYWPTTLNGELAAGEYDWGTDGKYYPGN